ncbi:MAG: dihydropyrimidinase, partial [Silvibacterium sp.]|nr:dihydropyrimidinase [Silvibacterium sp.]
MGLLIRHGAVANADRTVSADVLIEGDKIRDVRAGIDPQGHTIVETSGLLVLPGGIDAHTHLDMPFGGTTSADDFETGTRA